MKPQRATALFIALALCVIGASGNPARAQTGSAEYARQSDVIYGRKFGTALTMDVFRPKSGANGAAIVSVVSGGWFSSHDQAPKKFGGGGYTMFAVVHGSTSAMS